MYKIYFKRPLDIACALLGTVFFSWLLLLLALLVRVNLGRPILFRQERPGRHEQIFTLYKFRTMTDARNENGELLPDTVRLTGFGKLLRSTSLDELPELFNVLKGDMSLVGPRPLAVVYLPFYTESERRRHSVRPGLTGLAQVSGRNALSWEDRFSLDLKYVDNLTFLSDLKIFLATVLCVWKREGIGQGEEAPESLHVLRSSPGSGLHEDKATPNS